MKELAKEEVLALNVGIEYIIYNPLTETLKVEVSSPIDIVHNKHCYDKLRYFILGDDK